VVESGDYNGDSNADILWRESSGRVALWEMDGTAVLDNSLIANLPPNWQSL
jgi:hypothetical protein